MLDHRGLHWVQYIALREIVHCDQFTSMQLAHQQNARVGGLVSQFSIPDAPDGNGAGPAVPLVASLFGASGSFFEAQIIQHGLCGALWPQVNQLTAAQK